MKLFDLKNNLYHCCGTDFFGKEELAKHLELHPKDATKNPKPSLDWMVIIPGLDHVRLNGCKAIFKFLWDPFLKSVAERLGYCSTKALQIAHDCSDLHKSDLILAVFMEAGSQILGKYYLDNSSEEFKSPQGMMVFLENCGNPNVIFLRHVIYDYVLGYFLVKSGIRKNNKNYFLKGNIC